MIDLSVHNRVPGTTFSSSFFSPILESAVHVLGLKNSVGVSISIVGPAEMKKLNARRGKKTPTDVLSFALDAKRSADGIMELGDIVLCPKVLKENAKKEGKTESSMTLEMTVHGFLHLLGYDHERSLAEQAEMFALQDRILTNQLHAPNNSLRN